MIPYPVIDPVAVSLGPIQIHWYGLCYLAGIAAGWWLAVRRSARPWSPVRREQVDDLVFYVALGVVLGGRFGYILFYGWEKLLADPAWALRVWEGGMSFHGGFIGVMLAMWLYGRRQRIPFWRLMDFIAPFVPIGLGLGRVGNFIGQELWGRATDVPWAMVFPADPLGLARHPSQLYQVALEGVLLFTVLIIFSARPRPLYAVSGLFSLMYGCVRFGVEFVREPDAHITELAFGWMTRGQVLSAPMILVGVVLLALAYRGAQVQPQAAVGKAK
ncbi:MAG: prolipoprotein diacylglyceryl transferase [Halioglobus sp.]|nr:prolipoprotein diacylglyceryl transferase [Halioglobus sp.]